MSKNVADATHFSLPICYIYLNTPLVCMGALCIPRRKRRGFSMYFHGILLGLTSFVCIGIFHPIVVKCQYHFTERIWPLFLAAGIVCLGISASIKDVVASSVVGVFGFSCLWSIVELKEQTKRVQRGWFPKNPKHSTPHKKTNRPAEVNYEEPYSGD